MKKELAGVLLEYMEQNDNSKEKNILILEMNLTLKRN